MYTKLFITGSKHKEHLESPLLQERTFFLEQKEKEGQTVERLQVIAGYLLYSVTQLKLHEGQMSCVDLNHLICICHQYRKSNGGRWLKVDLAHSPDYRFNDVICNIFSWLKSMNLISLEFLDEKSVLNKVISPHKVVCRLKYYTAPFYHERLSHLTSLEKQGYRYRNIIAYAEYHLKVIGFLHLTGKSDLKDIRYSIEGLTKAAIQFSGLGIKPGSESRYSWFRTVSVSWFKHLGLITDTGQDYAGADVIDEYCRRSFNEKGLAQGTIVQIRSELKHFYEFIDKRHLCLDKVSMEDLDNYQSTFFEKGFARKTIVGRTSILKMFFAYAFVRGLMPKDLSTGLLSPKIYIDENLPTSPGKADVVRIANFYDESSPSCIRNKAILLLFIEYGMRRSEVANLKLHDIDWGKGSIVLNRIKVHKSQILKLKANVGNMLVNYLTGVRNNKVEYRNLFLSIKAPYTPLTPQGMYHIVSTVFKALNINLKHTGPHALRKAFATELVNSGSSFKDVADALGHRQLDTTRIYAKVDFVNLKKVSDMNWEGLL
jgi:site-specific recombinase XerD